MGAIYLSGTSFAAPWITRKLAYLIYVMGLSREVAKALIIDAAANGDLVEMFQIQWDMEWFLNE